MFWTLPSPSPPPPSQVSSVASLPSLEAAPGRSTATSLAQEVTRRLAGSTAQHSLDTSTQQEQNWKGTAAVLAAIA